MDRLGDQAEDMLVRLGRQGPGGPADVEIAQALNGTVSRDLIRKIADKVLEQATSRATVVKLVDTFGLAIDAAFALEKIHGNRADAEFREDPWAALLAAPGWGFRRTDAVVLKCQKLRDDHGIHPADLRRARHGLVHALAETATSGHCAQTEEDLIKLASHDLGPLAVPGNYTPSKGDLKDALEMALAAGQLRSQDDPSKRTPLCLTPWLDNAERLVAKTIAGRVGQFSPDTRREAPLMLPQRHLLSPEQLLAVERAVREPVVIIAGGPGTGKTFSARSAVGIWKQKGLRVALASPTARGAAALGAAVGDRASTLHRLLEWSPRENDFLRNRERPLDVDAVVVDEVSMLDVPLAAKLCAALPPKASLLFIGDPDQLPAVGPGALLRDLLACPRIPRVALTQIFRTSQKRKDSLLGLDASDVAVNARLVNDGHPPSRFRDFLELKDADIPEGAVFLETGPDADAARFAIVEAVRRLTSAGYDPLADVQVLAPMKRGKAGVNELNTALQDLIHQNSSSISAENRTKRETQGVRLGDRVIQLTNDYDIGVFNGDVGVVDNLNRNGSFVAKFHIGAKGWARVMYSPADVGDVIALAYCLTVHKAQGNEYPVVIMPVVPEANFMLTRPLLYTAISRAKKLLILVGSRNLLNSGVLKNSSLVLGQGLNKDGRVTGLVPRLINELGEENDRHPPPISGASSKPTSVVTGFARPVFTQVPQRGELRRSNMSST